MHTSPAFALRPLRDTEYAPSAYRTLYDDARSAYTSGEPLVIPAHHVRSLLDIISPIVIRRSFGFGKNPNRKA